MEARNDSQCLLLLLLAFSFYKELFSHEFSMYFFLLLSPTFIGADQLSFYATFTVTTLVALSEHGGNVSCLARGPR